MEKKVRVRSKSVLPGASYILVKRRSDGELFRHCTSLAGPFDAEVYDFCIGVYDSGGYLKSKYNEHPRTPETEQADSERTRHIRSLIGDGEVIG